MRLEPDTTLKRCDRAAGGLIGLPFLIHQGRVTTGRLNDQRGGISGGGCRRDVELVPVYIRRLIRSHVDAV